jgi:DNA-binding FadR family transcriptional regulator
MAPPPGFQAITARSVVAGAREQQDVAELRDTRPRMDSITGRLVAEPGVEADKQRLREAVCAQPRGILPERLREGHRSGVPILGELGF